MIFAVCFAIYCACTDFMLQASMLFGISYRDANAFLFFVLWPVVTLVLVGIVAGQALQLRSRRRE